MGIRGGYVGNMADQALFSIVRKKKSAGVLPGIEVNDGKYLGRSVFQDSLILEKVDKRILIIKSV